MGPSLKMLALAFATAIMLPAATSHPAARPQSQDSVEAAGRGQCHNNLGPIVSVKWLTDCMTDADVVTIDLRTAAEYAVSHIPGSISLPFEPVSAWSDMGPGDLLLEMPPASEVMDTLASVGISNPNPATKIVLVYGVGVPAFPQSAAPRVATTLKYVGVSTGRVTVLNGGFPAWVAAGKDVTTDVPTLTPGSYTADEDTSFLVDIDYVHARLDMVAEGTILLDGRDEAVYNGSVLEEWALVPGHIPSAVSLPARHIWTPEGVYKNNMQLQSQVVAALPDHIDKTNGHIIVYCGVGGYASSWYFVLTQVLGYTNVVMYDGSAQEWSRHYPMEID